MDKGNGGPRPLRIRERISENAKTISLVLDGSMACEPGQFGMLWLPGADEKPFSISGGDPLMFTVSRVGPFSDALHGSAGLAIPSGCAVLSGRAFPWSGKAPFLWAEAMALRPLRFWRRGSWRPARDAASRPLWEPEPRGTFFSPGAFPHSACPSTRQPRTAPKARVDSSRILSLHSCPRKVSPACAPAGRSPCWKR